MLVHILLEISIRKLVARLKFSVIFSLFLNRVIRQVHQFIGEVFGVVLAAGGSEVALLVKIAFQVSIDAGDYGERPYVELAFVDQERVLDVLLNDESALAVFHFAD